MGQVIPLHAPAPDPAPTWYATLAAVLAGFDVEPSQLQAAAYAATAAWDAQQAKLDRLRDELGRAQTAARRVAVELAEWRAGCELAL
jgi:hypothetical protein